MAEVISLSTFHGHNLTDQDHALFMQTVTSQSGLFYGCEVTLKDENTLHVSTGEGIACGRIFRIMDMDYPVELSASGDLLGRLYVHIDTALDDTPAQLMDVQGSTLPALIQEDDMNQSTGVYEIELATFSINELGISNLEFTAPKATGGGAGGKSIAPDYSATESYEIGRIFFQNGTLYKTIAAIPAGAPLVVDTNVIETSLASEIEALNQNLTLNYDDSSLPSSTTFNEFAQMVLEKLYPKDINVWKNGTFGVQVANGTYRAYSGYNTKQAFSISGNNLNSTITANSVTTTLVTSNKIDLTDLTTIKVITSQTSFNVDISAYTGEYYVCACHIQRGNGSRYFLVGISNTQADYGDNLVKQNGFDPSSTSVSVQSIIIE